MNMRTEYKPFFDALSNSNLRFPYCEACGRFHWYPMIACPNCQSADIIWREITPKGSVYSWTVVRHGFGAAPERPLPNVIALVTFPEAPGIRLLTNLEEVDIQTLAVGMQVQAAFGRCESLPKRLVFVPAQ